jgi:hypothetical protein
MEWYFFLPFIVLGFLLLLLLLTLVLGRVAGGRPLRAVVTRVPPLERMFTRMSIAALERKDPDLASAMKKIKTFGTPTTPEQAQRALALLTPAERKAYLAAAGEQQAQGVEPTNRQQRRLVERGAIPTTPRPQSRPGGKGKRRR